MTRVSAAQVLITGSVLSMVFTSKAALVGVAVLIGYRQGYRGGVADYCSCNRALCYFIGAALGDAEVGVIGEVR